jgi:hypothetical protein
MTVLFCGFLSKNVWFSEFFYSFNARLTEQIFDGGFCACFCTKDDSGNLSGAAVC